MSIENAPGFSKQSASTNGKGFTPQPKSDRATPSESGTAIVKQNQKVATALRETLSGQKELIGHLQLQRQSVTNYVADEIAEILDPASLQAEVAMKVVERLEGNDYSNPFELIDITAELVPTPRLVSSSGRSPRQLSESTSTNSERAIAGS